MFVLFVYRCYYLKFIFCAGNLDREEQSTYLLNIVASDQATDVDELVPANEARIGVSIVRITVKDVNDLSPTFSLPIYSITVSEKVPVGRTLFQFSASDKDLLLNGEITYLVRNMDANLFSLDPITGIVKTVNRINYEAKTQHNIIVYAQDRGNPPRVSTDSRLNVNVMDVNDVSPVFDKTLYEISIYENAPVNSFVINIHATDGDGTVSNRNLLYSAVNLGITPAFFFNTNGTVTVQRALDREVKDRYEFLVVATDMSTDVTEKRQGSSLLIINILDINDNTPSFSIYEYSVLISEATPVTSSIFKFSATDLDRTSTISYVPFSSSDSVWTLFQLDPSTGDVKVSGILDYETQNTYTMRIRASDNGTVPLFSLPSHLTIYIQDVAEGNSSLHFHKPRYSKQIPETYPVNIEFLYVNASSSMISSKIRYLIEPDSANTQNKVAINASTGGISLKVSADFETERYMAFTVAAVDPTSNILKGTAQVVIDILDVNDVGPITKPDETLVKISEDAEVGQIVTVFHTVDPDTDSQSAGGIIYEMDGNLPFTIIKESPTTGYLVTSATLDMETKSSYSIFINIKDRAQNIGNTLNIIVEIQDINDNNPIFTPSGMYQFNVQESNSTTNTVGTVSANDLDVTQVNKDVRYSIVRDGHNNRIDVNPITGVITINGAIDFEQTKNFEFTVIATDTAIPDQLKRKVAESVFVTVIDVNDNKPKFTNLQDPLYVKENTPVGHNIFIVSATDEDSGDGGKISFSSTMTSPFNITSDGKIMVTSQLDYETRTLPYSMVIVAADAGTPSLSQVQTLSISVVNVNDNKPIFQNLPYNVVVRENRALELLLTASASDADRGAFNQITYEIINPFQNIGPSKAFPFSVDRNNGEIRNVFTLDREQQGTYQFIVRANDNGSPQLSAVTFVNITVQDENDNNPAFEKPTYNITISENTIVGQVILRLLAKDVDKGEHGRVAYFLKSPSNKFNLDKTTGALSVKSTLSFAEQHLYTIYVTGVDYGALTNTGETTVYIHLTKSSGKTATFPSTYYDFSMTEASGVVGLKLNIPAPYTKDLGGNIAEYKIEYGHEFDFMYLKINSTNGNVNLKRNLDYELEKEHVFVIKVVSGSNIYGQQTVTLHVLDSNDHNPVFKQPLNKIVQISESTDVGQVIASVSASDVDRINQGKLTFKLTSPSSIFEVLSSNDVGTIYLKSELNAEVSPSHIIYLEVRDNEGGVSTQNAQITIEVTDENDNAPKFGQPQYVFNKDEGAYTTPFIGTVTASDQDATNFRKAITYRILGTNAQSTFKIESNGNIVLKRELDRETSTSHTFTVEASNTDDRKRIGVCLVTINVNDLNDNKPIVTIASSYTFYENTPVGTILFQLDATDKDAGAFGTINYALKSVDPPIGGSVGISLGTNGKVILTNGFDFETAHKHTVLIAVSDMGSPPNVVFKTFTLNILDINDNKPRFTIRPSVRYLTEVMENAVIGTYVAKLSATDADSNVNSKITYSINSVFIQFPFTINSTSGLITTSGIIDHETKSRYDMIVTATDHGNPSHSDSILVIVIVMDTNDNFPVFTSLSYAVPVLDNTPIGKSILKISAEDKDKGMGGRIIYFFVSGNDLGIFNLNKDTGVISLEKTLSPSNRKQRSTNQNTAITYKLVVSAKDSDVNDPHTAKVSAIVEITIIPSITGGAPKFYVPYLELSVFENYRGPLTETYAKGTDVVYSLIYDDNIRPEARNFKVYPNGVIAVEKKLDYEQQKQISFSINAQSSNHLNATQNVLVTVMDQDDNKPVISLPRQQTVTVNERSKVGQIVTMVSATDLDAVSKGKLTFSLVNTFENRFAIISASDVGTIIISKDLTNLIGPYDLQVKVRDAANNHADINADITVQIEQAVTLKFTKDVYLFEALENILNWSVGSVYTTSNGAKNIRYSISLTRNARSVAKIFAINEVTGSITTISKLDYESVTEHIFSITAKADNVLDTAVTTVHVIVADENDERPEFTSPTEHWFSELMPTGVSLFIVKATDRDQGLNSKITYSIIDSTPKLQLHINEDSGVVTYNGGLSYEVSSSYVVVVQAKDEGTPSMSSTQSVTINIINVNEFNPKFVIKPSKHMYTKAIHENTGINSEVLTVTANDKDAGIFGKVTYSILQSFSLYPFKINASTGVVSTTGKLDYEVKKEYNFVVIAADGGTPGRADFIGIHINITDLNDNAPVFNPHEYRISLFSSHKIGENVARVFATDADGDLNNVIRYSIKKSGNEESKFKIHAVTGVISVNNNKTSLKKTYVLEILAVDAPAQGGSLPSIRNAMVYITIDNGTGKCQSPILNPQYRLLRLQEDNPINQEIFRVIAAGNGNDNIQYKIVYSPLKDDEDLFVINTQSGSVSISNNLDYENKRKHTFLVNAFYTNIPTCISTQSIEIQVTDVNDNVPSFVGNLTQNILVSELTHVGQDIAVVQGTDADSINEGKLLFKLKNVNVPFEVRQHGDFGVIYLISSLDAEITRNYVLEIVVSDGIKTFDKSLYVTVTVKDENDKTPIFSKNIYFSSINENNNVPYPLRFVEAADNDTTTHRSTIQYKILETDMLNKFSINANTGFITVLSKLDYETQRNYHFTVVASNTDDQSRSGYAVVRIAVNDINDNPPKFFPPFTFLCF